MTCTLGPSYLLYYPITSESYRSPKRFWLCSISNVTTTTSQWVCPSCVPSIRPIAPAAIAVLQEAGLQLRVAIMRQNVSQSNSRVKYV